MTYDEIMAMCEEQDAIETSPAYICLDITYRPTPKLSVMALVAKWRVKRYLRRLRREARRRG